MKNSHTVLSIFFTDAKPTHAARTAAMMCVSFATLSATAILFKMLQADRGDMNPGIVTLFFDVVESKGISGRSQLWAVLPFSFYRSAMALSLTL